jgi:hypothetical protein
VAATVRTESSIVDSTIIDKGRLLGKGEAFVFVHAPSGTEPITSLTIARAPTASTGLNSRDSRFNPLHDGRARQDNGFACNTDKSKTIGWRRIRFPSGLIFVGRSSVSFVAGTTMGPASKAGNVLARTRTELLDDLDFTLPPCG